MEKDIVLKKYELERLRILHMILAQKMSQIGASEIMEISYRQTKRLVKRIKSYGDKSIAHANRGKPSTRKISPKLEKQIMTLYKANYSDFGPTLANEKLQELHGISMSTEKLRQILIQHDLWKTHSKRDSACHSWRQRKEHEGEMIQIDGSHHRWLEDRLDQEFCLIAFVDDATGKVFGRFYEYEGVFPILDSFQEFVKLFGIPQSVYLDRHSTYKTSRQPSVDEQLRDDRPLTQFEMIMKQIGVTVIHAYSPQAKGRVERSFQTFQDRLVKEMRLNAIKTIPAAHSFLDAYLPTYNQRFSVAPLKNLKLYKKIPASIDLKWTFALTDNRTIANDFTIRWSNRLFLLLKPSISLKGRKVQIKQALNGDILFTSKDRILTVKEISEHDLIRSKENRIDIIRALKQKDSHPKSKKNWMDGFYFGRPKIALVK